MNYLSFLAELHLRLAPRTYLEVGLRNGDSFARSRARSVGIDPAYTLTAQLPAGCSIFRTTSDEYFSRAEPLAPTGGVGFDLAFIDGLHLFEYSLRDFIHAERNATPNGVIVFDDVLPRSSDEAARARHTQFWTGDVFKIALVLRAYRPDLTCVTVNTWPTGLLLVMGVDPASRILVDNFGEVLATFRTPDPQVVPRELIERSDAIKPDALLRSECWNVLRAVRDQQASAEIRGLVAAAVGTATRSGPVGPTAASGATALLAAAGQADATIDESAAGVLLTMRWPGAAGAVAVDATAQLRFGDLVLPARLDVADGDAVLTAWLSGLPGRYQLGLTIGDQTADTGLCLVLGPAGELTIEERPPADPEA